MFDFLGVSLVRVFGALLWSMPLSVALGAGRFVGSFWYHIVRVRRRVVIRNLRHVFPEKSVREIHALARAFYRDFVMTVVEILRFANVTPEKFENRTTIEGIEEILELQKAGSPVIVCSAHAGNWDLLGFSAGTRDLELTVVGRPMKSQHFHRLLMGTREQFGVHMIMKGVDAFHELFDLIDEGKTVVILPDQNARTHGVTVDFLGQPASTFQGPAVLHLVTGAPIAVIIDRRSTDDPRDHHARFRLLPAHESTGDRKRDIHAVTQQISDALSEEILENPAQYFWLHHRWGKLQETSAKAAGKQVSVAD